MLIFCCHKCHTPLPKHGFIMKKRLLPTSSSPSIFHPVFAIPTLEKQTNPNKTHYSTIFQLVTPNTVTLVTAKTQKLLLYTCMYARTRSFSHSSFHISQHAIFTPLPSPIKSPPPSIFFFHLFPMPSPPFPTFHKTTACFS